MYHCPECQKDIDTCPKCKQPIKDNTAALLYQISGVFFFVALVFFALEGKVREETDLAMRPFKVTEEIAAKKAKVKAATLPKPPKEEKATKAKDEEVKKEDKKEKKEDKIEGKDADFRVGRWGTSRKRIEEEEKAEKINRDNPYSLEYFAKVGDCAGITRYQFSSNRLIGGDYVVFGDKIKNLAELISETQYKAGEACSTSIQNEFSLYPFPRNPGLSEIDKIDQFFYGAYISLTALYGIPSMNNLGDLENSLSRHEKVTSVLVFDRMIRYEWSTKRTNIEFIFAANAGIPYFFIAYREKKPGK